MKNYFRLIIELENIKLIKIDAKDYAFITDVNIQNRLKNKTYRLGNYFSFKVYEPKERTIQALPYQDRIVHQWYVEEFIKPYIIPRFIDTTFACLNDRGTHAAVKEVQKQMRIFKRNYGDFWVLKCDIRKYFQSIDHEVLLNLLKNFFTI